jgi:hypothetical protein
MLSPKIIPNHNNTSPLTQARAKSAQEFAKSRAIFQRFIFQKGNALFDSNFLLTDVTQPTEFCRA